MTTTTTTANPTAGAPMDTLPVVVIGAGPGWREPDPEVLLTGHQLVEEYLAPLASALGPVVRTGSSVQVVR